MYEGIVELREPLRDAHARSWAELAEPGAHLTAAERLALVAEARAASGCDLCRARKRALSPYGLPGGHAAVSSLGTAEVELAHRLSSDPGRLTRAWFDGLVSVMGAPRYVEAVSVICAAVIVDTLHRALGLAVPGLPPAQGGAPSGELNAEAVEAGAWVPVLAAPQDLADTGLPTVPNIARALGLVPGAVKLFFRTFRPHYQLQHIQLAISQDQAEFVASRVSALNECFY